MIKKIRFPTISLGSEPDQPDISELTGFVRTHAGQEADLVTFKLVRSLNVQLAVGITQPCAGGLFMLPRFADAIRCSPHECHGEPSLFLADAGMMTRTAGPVRSALPAPGLIPGSPDPSHEELYVDFCDVYAGILREMRDLHITGHFLHARDVCPLDAERLASRKTIFVAPDGGRDVQSRLLEFQNRVVLTTARVPLLDDLIDHYDIRSLVLVDPDEEGFKKAMEHLDPDQISVGGYGVGSESDYWRGIADLAAGQVRPK